MNRYEGKKALITGGTTGIGFATAKALLDGGGEVLVTGRNEATLDAARRELGPRAHVVRSDAANLADVDALATTAKDALRSVDLLFLNAGISKPAPLDRVTEALYDETFAVNVKGAYFTAQRIAPLLHEGGAVVLNTSVAASKGIAGTTVYAASKAALRSLARTLAGELLPRGIRVNAVSPGPILTPINAKFGFSKEGLADFERDVAAANPMKRFGTAGEVASAVLFLAFEATYTTGVELPVDGGFTQL
ncbi:MAG: SDR family oxidoreductase [Labilithrix sp.]|nr:SDR family oxidoreductase [Labilithrix sp.]